MKSVVIVGASHAAVEAISILRRKGWEGKIYLVGDEDALPYQRPPLSKAYYQGELGAERLVLRNDAFYLDNKVDLMLGRRAESIDRVGKTVLLDDGQTLEYDKLILATGTRARFLPVQGGDLPNIFYLRSKGDVDRIRGSVAAGSRLLIVGAGYIGLELAASAVKQGVDVVVLEAADRVLARVTSSVVSEFYQRVHAQEGVDIRLNVRLAHFEKTVDGHCAVLADGQTIAFDNVVVGIGVIPNIELADDAGLDCDNGIIVDEFTRTGDADIYAVGDCSSHPNFIYDQRIRLESVPNATGQAKTAALSICGEDVAYDQVPWFWSDQYDVKLQTAGLMQGFDHVVVRGDSASRKFSVFYLREGRLLAVDAINSPAEFMVAKKLVTQKAQLDPDRIADMSVSAKELLG